MRNNIYTGTKNYLCFFSRLAPRGSEQQSSFQGSNTLPRAGAKKKTTAGGGSVDDSEIVITKKLTGTGSSVRIRIGGSARSPTENIEKVTDSWPAEAAAAKTAGDTGSGSLLPGKISRNETKQQPRFGKIFYFKPVCG